ncbi:hypothetical protein E2C01_026652 [Portunus trituberculatus]|uniref:Uncharacterized protein n=1 Tax=Portunus trituberculatus TaxID=210409 RepID=A0A5B7EIX0_PORTR|nr:hypothetical protein [Portunus trituberculatus]
MLMWRRLCFMEVLQCVRGDEKRQEEQQIDTSRPRLARWAASSGLHGGEGKGRRPGGAGKVKGYRQKVIGGGRRVEVATLSACDLRDNFSSVNQRLFTCLSGNVQASCCGGEKVTSQLRVYAPHSHPDAVIPPERKTKRNHKVTPLGRVNDIFIIAHRHTTASRSIIHLD